MKLNNYPLLEHTQTRTAPNGCLTFFSHVNIRNSPYFAHHRFPIGDLMPATVIFEYLLEAACARVQNIVDSLHGLSFEARDFIIERALPLQSDDSLDIEVHVDRIVGDVPLMVSVSMTSKRVNSRGKLLGVKRHAAGVFAFQVEHVLHTEDSPISGTYTKYETCAPELYDTLIVSHGDMFRSLTGLFYLSSDKTELLAEYNCSDKEQRWLSSGNCNFVVSPLGFDSCLQTACLLSILQDGYLGLPVSVESLRLYRKHPSSESCKVKVSLTNNTSQTISTDLIAVDKDGAPIIEAFGVTLRKNTVLKPEESGFLYRWLEKHRTEEEFE